MTHKEDNIIDKEGNIIDKEDMIIDKEDMIIDKEDMIIDMMEPGKSLSSSDYQKIEEDEELRSMCKDILSASAAIRQQRIPVKAMAKLAEFKKSHSKDENSQIEENISQVQISQAEGNISQEKTSQTEGDISQIEEEITQKHHTILKPLLWLSAAAVLAFAFILFFPFNKKTDASEMMAETVRIETEEGDGYNLPASRRSKSEGCRPVVVEASKMPETVTMTIPYGDEAVVNLADGSKVYLHPGSKLHFPNKFVGNKRVVTLEGEAYFEVSHDTSHPFIVKTAYGSTKVLGTEFDVSAYDGKTPSVTLVKGKVQVANPSHTTILNPGSKAVWTDEGEIMTSQVDTESLTLWKEGYLFYDNMPLDEILHDISLYYKVNFKYNSAEIHHLRMRFMVNRRESVGALVDAINAMQAVKAHLVDDNTIIISNAR